MIQCKDIPLRTWASMFMLGVGKKKVRLGSLIGEGNLKIPSTTAIFNMTSAKDCPSLKLGLCKAFFNGKHICYAKKSENEMRKNVLPYRRRQEAYWREVTANEFVSEFILINSTKRNPFKYIRFNESGDFISQDCVDKAEKIANMLHRFGVKCYCYTSRSDLNFSKCRYLVVSGSNFKRSGISNIFKIIGNKKELTKGYKLCVGDCKVCNRCTLKNMKTCIVKH
jgi:hypothetical protein